MAYRIRELTDAGGARTRLSIVAGDAGVLLRLERPEAPDDALELDLYGAEILAGFILSARLSHPDPQPEERTHGPHSARYRLVRGRIEVEQGRAMLAVPASFWDRLYAELDLAIPHARALQSRPPAARLN